MEIFDVFYLLFEVVRFVFELGGDCKFETGYSGSSGWDRSSKDPAAKRSNRWLGDPTKR